MAHDATLTWDSVPERKAWLRQLLESIASARQELDRGKTLQRFAPGYSGLAAPRQKKFWAELFIAIARFESNWNPHDIFHEPPPLGVDSVGLLQLSYEDEPVYHLEHLDRNVKSLEDPLVNLRCGVKIMQIPWSARTASSRQAMEEGIVVGPAIGRSSAPATISTKSATPPGRLSGCRRTLAHPQAGRHRVAGLRRGYTVQVSADRHAVSRTRGNVAWRLLCG